MSRTIFVSLAAALAILAAAAGFLVMPSRSSGIPAPGIALTLAEDRAARISSLAYDVNLEIPAVRTESIRGKLSASFTLRGATRPLPFDFAQAPDHVLTVTVNGRPLQIGTDNGHVVIPASSLNEGPNTVAFDFRAGDESLNRTDEFLYSLFVPARASLAMPCLDQPDLKARWRLSLAVPPGWTAVSNGAEMSGAGRLSQGPQPVRFVFQETQPLPSYSLIK